MKKSTCLLILFTGIFSLAIAQKSAVTAGVIAYQDNRIDDAIEKLKEGISDESLFPDKKMKFLKKGQYYLALAYAKAANDPEMSTKYPGAALEAGKLYEAGTSGEYGAAWKKAAETEGAPELIANAAFNQGISVYNAETDPSNTAANNYDNAEPYFEISNTMKPKYFMTKYLLGSVKLNKVNADTAAAINILQSGIDLYKELYIEEKDPNQLAINKTFPGNSFATDSNYIANAYELLGAIMDASGDSTGALALISEGIEILPEAENLKRRELAIYNLHPSLFEQAKSKFEAAITANPDDLPIKLAYANMLDRRGESEAAFALFKDVYERDNGNINALFQLGRHYNNMAVEAENKKNELSTRATDQEYEAAEDAIKVELKNAMPYFVKLNELQPDEPEWLRILVNITSRLGDDEKMNTYYERLKVVQGN